MTPIIVSSWIHLFDLNSQMLKNGPSIDLWLSLNDERLKETQNFLDQLGWSCCAFRCHPFNFCCSTKNEGEIGEKQVLSSWPYGAQCIYIYIFEQNIHIPQTCLLKCHIHHLLGWNISPSKVHLARQHRHRNSNASVTSATGNDQQQREK